jgi:hypothetical protein
MADQPSDEEVIFQNARLMENRDDRRNYVTQNAGHDKQLQRRLELRLEEFDAAPTGTYKPLVEISAASGNP